MHPIHHVVSELHSCHCLLCTTNVILLTVPQHLLFKIVLSIFFSNVFHLYLIILYAMLPCYFLELAIELPKHFPFYSLMQYSFSYLCNLACFEIVFLPGRRRSQPNFIKIEKGNKYLFYNQISLRLKLCLSTVCNAHHVILLFEVNRTQCYLLVKHHQCHHVNCS